MSFYHGKEVSVEPYQYFHVTTKNLGEIVILDPDCSRIDFENSVSSDEIEGDEFISFGPTIRDCLTAMGHVFHSNDCDDYGRTRQTVYVYTPVSSTDMYRPEHIHDWEWSGEVRSDEPVQCKRVGILSILLTRFGDWFHQPYKYKMKVRWIKKD